MDRYGLRRLFSTEYRLVNSTVGSMASLRTYPSNNCKESSLSLPKPHDPSALLPERRNQLMRTPQMLAEVDLWRQRAVKCVAARKG